MNNTVAVNLTSEELNNLEVAICASKLDLERDIDRLSEHNETGINTKKINTKKELIKKLDLLFTKLYEAEKEL